MKLAILINALILISAVSADRDHLEVKNVAAPAAAPAAPAAAATQPAVKQIQNRDGAHHHHHHHAHQEFPQASEYQEEEAHAEEPAFEESQQQHVIYEPEAQEAQAPPSFAQPAAYPSYSQPGHTGYYYYYYPVKASKPKFKFPFSKKIPSLKLPEYIGKEGHEGGSSIRNVWAPAVTSLLVASGLYWALPILGLGAGRSGRAFTSSPYLNRENVKAMVQYINRVIERYEEQQQQNL